jgi:hypothetical protein
MSRKTLDIVLDFDGTCVGHDFPDCHDIPECVRVLKRITAHGHRLILHTMRSDWAVEAGHFPKGSGLCDAVSWFGERGIPLFGIQRHPTQHEWTSSNKAYGQLIIDDTCLGVELINDPTISSRPFVDWNWVETKMEEKGFL